MRRNRNRSPRLDLVNTLHLVEAAESENRHDPHRLKLEYEGIIILRLFLEDSRHLQDVPYCKAGVLQRWCANSSERVRIRGVRLNSNHKVIEINATTATTTNGG